jgi:hypothetical protein
MNLAGGLIVLSGVCLLAIVGAASAEYSVHDQTIYDERMDVHGGTGGEALTHTEVDILDVAVSDTARSGKVMFWMRLDGEHSPDAVYTVSLRIDNQYSALLEFRDGDNWTGSDDRDPVWSLIGKVIGYGATLQWEVPVEVVNASRSLVVVEANAKVLVEETKQFSDVCKWDEMDISKGSIRIIVTYYLKDGERIVRDVHLEYSGQSAAGFRYFIDTDGDHFITPEEIDFYLEDMEQVVNWTDMSMKFNQHTARRLEMSVDIEPGPLATRHTDVIDSDLYLTYPNTRAREINYAWELELGDHFNIPYWRADNHSTFRITNPSVRADSIYVFSQWDLTPITEQFYNTNFTRFQMNGTLLRAYWNDTMRDSQGITLFAEDRPSDPNDSWCNVGSSIMVVTAGFMVVQGGDLLDRGRRWMRRRSG